MHARECKNSARMNHFEKVHLTPWSRNCNISSGQLLQYFQILFPVVALSCEFKVYSPDKTISIADSANN